MKVAVAVFLIGLPALATEEDARRIGRQIMRENALEIFPQLRQRLWRDRDAR